MKVLILALCYAPEEVSAAVLITELANDLRDAGHTVQVVTTPPNYPYGRVFAGYRNRLLHAEVLDGVQVYRTGTILSPRRTVLLRALRDLSFSISAIWGCLAAGRPDVMVCFSPPLPLGLSAWLLSSLWHVPWILQINDLYPEAVKASGLLQGDSWKPPMEAMARFQYKRASRISVIASAFRDTLLGQGVPEEKITLIPVWADPQAVLPQPRKNGFRAEMGLGDDFVVLYAGNLGMTSCLEDLIEAAGLLREHAHIRFVLVGEGARKADLQQQAAGLENVLFLPYQPRAQYAEMLAAADMGVVTINSASACSSLPSKLFNILASARPVLGIAPDDCEVTQLVQKFDCGVSVPPGNADRLANVILECSRQPSDLEAMGARGRAALEKHYSRCYCTAEYERMLVEVSKR
ncbi:MAG: glycosyltransferase family 4 protein [Anaerolineae bacterium]|nr:glycosyltransferase family 4 protein [Anaerolineae bacterium]